MSDPDDGFGDLEGAADRAVVKADKVLEARLSQVMKLTRADLERLRPEIPANRQQTYEDLIAAVDEATRVNEQLATLRARIKRLADDGGALIERALTLAGKVV